MTLAAHAFFVKVMIKVLWRRPEVVDRGGGGENLLDDLEGN
jgi:hypothetical protein